MDLCTEVDSHQRQPLNQQPAQCILIDLMSPLSSANLDSIAECLHNVLPVISVLPGPPRVPLLSILVANNLNGIPEEVILGFEKVRSNFTRCFEAVRSMHTEFTCSKPARGSQSITTALIKSLNMYQNIIKKPGMQFEVEITIISPLLGYKVREQVAKALNITGIGGIKLVTIFCLQHKYNIDIDDIEMSEEGDGELSPPGSAVTDTVNMQYRLLTNESEEDKRLLWRHFMGWLSDRNKDTYSVQFKLPHPYKDSEELDLKFDLKELLLPTSAIPFHNKTSMELSAAFMKPPHLLTKSDSVLKYVIQIHSLKILYQVVYTNQLIPYLYGTPMILEPTQCWRIDWDELEQNKSTINTLHSTLLSKNLALVCQLEPSEGDVEEHPLPYYCIVPTMHCLLIHHLAYKELFLHQRSLSVKQEASSSYQMNIDMDMSLKKIELKDKLEPEQLEGAGYIKCLTRSLLPKRLYNKKRPVTSSSTSSKRVKSRYPPLDGCPQQPMDMDLSCMNNRKKASQRSNLLTTEVLPVASVADIYPKSSAALSKLHPTRRSLSHTPTPYVKPSIVSQLEDIPSISNAGQSSMSKPRWITRDDSKPVCSSTARLSTASHNFSHGNNVYNKPYTKTNYICTDSNNNMDLTHNNSNDEDINDYFLFPMDCEMLSQSNTQQAGSSSNRSTLSNNTFTTPKVSKVCSMQSSGSSVNLSTNERSRQSTTFRLEEEQEVEFVESSDGTLSPAWQDMSVQEG